MVYIENTTDRERTEYSEIRNFIITRIHQIARKRAKMSVHLKHIKITKVDNS